MRAENLEKLGLTKNEAVLYLGLLRLGESKVSALVKNVRFRSGKVYEVLDGLVEKGLVAYSEKNSVKYYSAQKPMKLKEYMRQRKREIVEQERVMNGMLLQLNGLYDQRKDACSVKVFEGVEGIRTALFKFLDRARRNEVVFVYGANDDVKRDVVLQWRKYEDVLVEKNITNRIIMSQMSKAGRAKRRKSRNKYKNYRYLAGQDISNFMVIPGTVLLFNFDEKNVIMIENRAHARQFMGLFDVLWKNAERL